MDGSLAVLGNFPDVLENTSEKAQVSPLGCFFHSSIYPPLSLVAHQSYMHLEHEAVSFDDNDLSDISARVKQLGRWLDILTAALLVRVRNDVGLQDK
ncbi:MAG: hypothetical protein JO081_16890 [Alphaproteobacteria bacterium]|nr:hypothetical protein [Alphaproteobacteria bacterium]